MPTCPGCRRQVAHGDLPTHERYCPRIWAECGEEAERGDRWGLHLAQSMRSLDARVADTDSTVRLVSRVERLEKRLEKRLDDRLRGDE